MNRKYSRQRNYNYGNRKTHLPEQSFGRCYLARLCGNTNVELGNGYCMTCWDKKCWQKIIF